MKFFRQRLLYLVLHLAVCAAASSIASSIVWAQAYPTRPVRILVGFAPGGTSDMFSRLIGQWLSQRLGQQFIVENRPGMGGSIATEVVAKAPPDGYTLANIGGNNSWNVALYNNLNFDFIRDISPVASTHMGIGVLVVHPSFPAMTM